VSDTFARLSPDVLPERTARDGTLRLTLRRM
jgi:hypothetical protein